MLVAAAANAQTADAEPPVFRTGVSLVTVDAKVTTRDGRDVGGLNAQDFAIYDENERRPITNFGREATPVEVVLLIDVSPEMRPYLLELTPHVAQALEPLRPGDRAAAILFGARTEIIQPLTGDLMRIPREVVDNIYKDRYGRGTLVNEALVEAARYLRSEPAKGRRTIIVITNNRGTRSSVSDEQAVRALLGVDSVLNVILVGSAAGPRSVLSYHNSDSVQPDVYRYAGDTGGEVVRDSEPAKVLRRMIESAKTRYSLQFPAPQDATGLRHLRVELSVAAQARYPGAAVQARNAYQAPN